jgi:arginine/lysine/ornithine decarboxylase
MIHWHNGRINKELLIDSYRRLTTSSPSFLLLASIDAAREMMEKKGVEKIDQLLSIARHLTVEINKIEGFEIVSKKMLKKINSSVFSYDETKLIINVTKTGYTGFEIASLLEKKYKIIVEKYNRATILLLVPFRATLKDVQITINAFQQIARQSKNKKISPNGNLELPINIPKILELGDVSRLLWDQIEKVPLVQAEGRIAAEQITPYPPGIPTTIKGEEFTPELIAYYSKLKEYPNSHFVAQDKSLETVLVVK